MNATKGQLVKILIYISSIGKYCRYDQFLIGFYADAGAKQSQHVCDHSRPYECFSPVVSQSRISLRIMRKTIRLVL